MSPPQTSRAPAPTSAVVALMLTLVGYAAGLVGLAVGLRGLELVGWTLLLAVLCLLLHPVAIASSIGALVAGKKRGASPAVATAALVLAVIGLVGAILLFGLGVLIAANGGA